MIRYKRQHLIVLVVSGFLSVISIPAIAAVDTDPVSAFPFVPQISAWGYAGSDQLISGDFLTPVWGNDHHLLYLDPQGKVDEDQNWMAGVGAGYRYLFNSQNIVGAYLFFDANALANNAPFWFVSPGLEWMNSQWSYRINGYLPISSTTRTVDTVYADEIGIASGVTVQGHQQFAYLYNENNEVGPGLDMQIGRIFPQLHDAKLSLGGYHFSFKNSADINGIEGGLELPFNHFLSLSVTDSYDNSRHNTILAGLGFHLGRSSDHSSMTARMLEPLSRNISTIGQGNGTPIVKIDVNTGQQALERDDVWFFTSQGGSAYDASQGANNCTIPLSKYGINARHCECH